MGRGKFGIPDRWEKYSAIGSKIENTPFIAFKVPLNELLCAQLPNLEASASASASAESGSEAAGSSATLFYQPWTTEAVFQKCPEMSLVVDLTNTDRYYKSKMMRDSAAKEEFGHVKINTKGHVVPDMKVVKRFFHAVDRHLEEHEDGVIGVHCTHGVNRTGYLICRYLVQRRGWNPQEALDAFKTARGYPVERQNYIDDLIKAKWPDIWPARKSSQQQQQQQHPEEKPEKDQTSSSQQRRRDNRHRNRRSRWQDDDRTRRHEEERPDRGRHEPGHASHGGREYEDRHHGRRYDQDNKGRDYNQGHGYNQGSYENQVHYGHPGGQGHGYNQGRHGHQYQYGHQGQHGHAYNQGHQSYQAQLGHQGQQSYEGHSLQYRDRSHGNSGHGRYSSNGRPKSGGYHNQSNWMGQGASLQQHTNAVSRNHSETDSD